MLYALFYDNFLTRLPQLLFWYELEGYNYAKHVYDVKAQFTPNAEEGALEVKLSTLDNQDIHYTLDGTTPTATSPKYDGNLKLTESAHFKAAVVKEDGRRPVEEEFNFNKASLKPIKALQPINDRYKFAGEVTLVDGMRGAEGFGTGRWIAFYGNPMDMVIDLKEATEIKQVSIATLVGKGDWIFDARSLSVEVSDNGETFTKVASEAYPPMAEADRNGIYEHAISFAPVQARYVRVVATTESSIPAWHGGKGKQAFLFVDEIVVE